VAKLPQAKTTPQIKPAPPKSNPGHDGRLRMYLKNVLDRMLSGETDYSRLVPDVWKADHPEAVREYRVAESRQKEDRKQITRARRIVAAKLKREQTASQ